MRWIVSPFVDRGSYYKSILRWVFIVAVLFSISYCNGYLYGLEEGFDYCRSLKVFKEEWNEICK